MIVHHPCRKIKAASGHKNAQFRHDALRGILRASVSQSRKGKKKRTEPYGKQAWNAEKDTHERKILLHAARFSAIMTLWMQRQQWKGMAEKCKMHMTLFLTAAQHINTTTFCFQTAQIRSGSTALACTTSIIKRRFGSRIFIRIPFMNFIFHWAAVRSINLPGS